MSIGNFKHFIIVTKPYGWGVATIRSAATIRDFTGTQSMVTMRVAAGALSVPSLW